MGVIMNSEDKAILCSLIRDHEDTVGASRVTIMAINAFIESIRQVRCSVEELGVLHAELSEVIKNTEPKVIPLIHLLEEFENEIGASTEATIDEVKALAIRILEQKVEKIRTKIGKVVEYGLTCINDGDVIVAHTISYDVTNMLKLARQVLHKDFKMIVLKQDLAKTRRLIKSLAEADIEMEIVPEYSLSHYIERGNKFFMGALSITDDCKVVSAAGSANIVGLCHLNNLPVYVFANSLKFSHRPSAQQQIHRKVEAKNHGDVSFQLITHSHDTVDLKHVDFLVTENGIKDKAAVTDFIKNARC
jgi:translation initiation factor 2B subunit (eIF-2B alpha/beta/delta family)